MQTFEIPIFKKGIELYKMIHLYRASVPKQDRYTIWLKCENLTLDILGCIMTASQLPKASKLPELTKVSQKLNQLRIFLRLAKEVKAVNNKHYVGLEKVVNEIGRMLGGWIRSSRENTKQNTLHCKESILN